jgi:acetyl-CoA carboxylase biotin carboxyl carrier protein
MATGEWSWQVQGVHVTRIPTDPEQIRQLAVVMAENGLIEVELVDKDTKVRVIRATSESTARSQPVVSYMSSEPTARHTSPVSDPGANSPGAITSPMVGVAFLAPEPGAPAFVTVGQQVSVGQTLLLIEAMKTFNEIKATRSGIVTNIIVQNSTPVEYGELLMIVE